MGWRWGLWWRGEGWPHLCSSQWPSCVHVGLVWQDLQIVLVKWEIQSVIQSLVLQRLVAIFFFFFILNALSIQCKPSAVPHRLSWCCGLDVGPRPRLGHS